MSKKNNGVNPIKVVELPDLKPNQIGSVKPIEDGKKDLWEGELILEDRVLYQTIGGEKIRIDWFCGVMPYVERWGNIYRLNEGNKLKLMKLANFNSFISNEVFKDDGNERVGYFTIQGKIKNHNLPNLEVKFEKFFDMRWPSLWGNKCVIHSAPNVRDLLRQCIQETSNKQGVESYVCYTHTGWRLHNDKWTYLSASGGDDVKVELSKELERYRLPLVVEDKQEDVIISLAMLGLAKPEIAYPLWTYTYLAPLTTLLAPIPNFSLYLYGLTGSFKSTLATLALSHFGNFEINQLSNFSDTANSLEYRAFILKDTLMVLDDLHPAEKKETSKNMESIAQRLIRSFSNRTGRGRLNSDASDRGRYEPRGMLIITGEELVGLQSTLARVLVLDVNKDDVDVSTLTNIQKYKHLLPQAMKSYINWIGEHIDEIKNGFYDTFCSYRTKAYEELANNSPHSKTPEIIAYMQYAFDLSMKWLLEEKHITTKQADEYKKISWETLIKLSIQNTVSIQSENPITKFGEIVKAMWESKYIRVEGKSNEFKTLGIDENDFTLLNNGDKILTIRDNRPVAGYYDDEWFYLIMPTLWHEFKVYLQREGGYFPMSERSLIMAMEKKNLIEKGTDRLTTLIKVDGKVNRVVKIKREVFLND